MKVLLLHQHFKTPYKGGAIRSYYLARALVDHGIETIVITAHNQRRYAKEIIDGIEVHYLPVPYDNSFGFYKRAFSFLNFVWRTISLSRKFRDADICYAISVPLTVGIAAWIIKIRYNVPFIFEVGDLWPDAPIQMGVVKNELMKRTLYQVEKRTYEHAASVVALSVPIEESIRRKISGKKIYVLPNISDTDFFKPEPKDPLLEQKFGVEGKFVVSYIGAIGAANGLDHLLECARHSEKAQFPVHFLVAGEGALRDSLVQFSKSLGLKNLTLLPFQDRSGVKEIMNVTDASFICYKPVPILETGSPNKYFDALAAGKLIVINFGGWIKKEIESSQCGIFIDPKNPAAFANLIRPFVVEKNRLRQYQQNSRYLAEKKYSRKKLSAAFVDLVLQSTKESFNSPLFRRRN